jgi:hypothetical protein
MKVYVFRESLNTIEPPPVFSPNPPEDAAMIQDGRVVEIDIPSRLLGALQVAQREVHACVDAILQWVGADDVEDLFQKGEE